MLNLVIDSGISTLFNILQLVIGCIISILISSNNPLRKEVKKPGFLNEFICIVCFSILGAALPLNVYGVIPIMAAFLYSGFKYYTVMPLILSNLVFNMLVPFNDASFVWRNGINRVFFAIILGTTAGLAFKLIKCNEIGIFNMKNMPAPNRGHISVKGIGAVLSEYINALGLYLIIGVILDSIFQKHVLPEFFNLIFSNTYSASMLGQFGTYDVGNSFFQLMVKNIYMLMDLAKISALLAIFKIKGLISVLGYYMIWIVLLCVAAFI